MAIALWPSAARADWLQASSEHFVIYADDSERDVSRFSDQLERYHAALALVLRRKTATPSPSNRVTVYVVRNQRAVRQLYGEGNRYVGGFYIPRAGGSLAIVPKVDAGNGVADFSMVTLLHEYAHHFLISANSMAMPRWLSEGAAEFFASVSFDKDGGMMIGRPAQHRAAELFYAPDVKVADLLDPAEYEKRSSGSYDAFYGKSWLLYHYLTFEKARSGQLDRYLELLRDGSSMRDAGLQAFGDFDALEKELDHYLNSRRMQALKLPPDLLKIGAVQLRHLSDGEAAIMPLRIRSRRGVDAEEAKEVLDEAREVAARYPNDPAVLAELAEAEYDVGDDQEAVTAADRALAVDPSQVNAYVQKGYALFRLAAEADDKPAAYRRARAPFIALNHRENDHPLPLMYFYRSFVEQGEEPPDLAVAGLIRASELAPFDLGLRMTLATTLIRLDRQDEAKIALRPIAYNPHGGSLAGVARLMLERLESDPAWNGADMDTLLAAAQPGGDEGEEPSSP
ncbi:DUF1570 domain-containing protein [Novosphingobium malaysiense]|nr:DUF1570 domain-containing protein [Novosphingobium malaysiense]